MHQVRCPICSGAATCVDSRGYQWRCYGHGEHTFDVRDQSLEQQEAAATEAAGLRSLSQTNARTILERNRDE